MADSKETAKNKINSTIVSINVAGSNNKKMYFSGILTTHGQMKFQKKPEIIKINHSQIQIDAN